MRYFIAYFLTGFLVFHVTAKAETIDLSRAPELVLAKKTTPFYAQISIGNAFATSNHGNAPMLASLGVGYQYNDLLRFNANVEFRNDNTIKSHNILGGNSLNYQSKVATFDAMANAYLDLATIRNVTPYIGAGIGVAHHQLDTIKLDNSAISTIIPQNNSRWDVAWAIHAGFAWHFSKRAALDIGYSYSNLGKAQSTSAYDAYHGQNIAFDTITAHDIKIGLRYSF